MLLLSIYKTIMRHEQRHFSYICICSLVLLLLTPTGNPSGVPTTVPKCHGDQCGLTKVLLLSACYIVKLVSAANYVVQIKELFKMLPKKILVNNYNIN